MCNPAWAHARIAAQRLHDLARLRRIRDRIDRDCAHPLDLVALARDAGMPAGCLARQFAAEYGESPYDFVTRRRTERGVTRAA
ncbi:hypothetical protein ACFYVL_09825 [Streptomyces sp. NPDC004111]|uniref:hypothetical protein n=1 Tax=Streptomyces sp. NPDC004111 TaxID=3364690 RepID=UPI0036C8864E